MYYEYATKSNLQKFTTLKCISNEHEPPMDATLKQNGCEPAPTQVCTWTMYLHMSPGVSGEILSSLVLMREKAKHSIFDTTKQWNSNERLIFKFRIKVLLFISGDIRRRDISTPLFLSAFRTLSPCPWQPDMAGVQNGSCSASPTMRTRRTMIDLMILRCKRSFASQKC